MASGAVHRELVSINNQDISNYISVEDCDIYHYTSPMGLNGILSNHTLRFTDRNYLNDYSEGRYVMELCLDSRFEWLLPKGHRAYFKKYCKILFDNPLKKSRYIYQCSFSTNNDNLALWNYYTKSDGIKGYNLGFKTTELSQNLVTHAESENRGIRIFHGKVVYSKNNQKAIIRKIVSDFKGIIEEHTTDTEFCKLAIELLIEKILFVGAFFKDPHFAHENEYRLLLHLVQEWDTENNCARFMVIKKGANTYEKNGLLIPYLDIKFSNSDLKSISISPTLSFEETESNIRNALKIHSYNADAIQILKSNTPVRY